MQRCTCRKTLGNTNRIIMKLISLYLIKVSKITGIKSTSIIVFNDTNENTNMNKKLNLDKESMYCC